MSDVLSVIRDVVSTERQTRLGEMQIALGALQYESERQFRQEGRQREDAMTAIEAARSASLESMSRDAGSIYARTRSLAFIERDDGGKIEKFKSGRKGVNLGGMTEAEAVNIYNMVSLYESDNPKQQQMGEEMAFTLGRKVSKQYDYWRGAERDPKSQTSLLKGLTNLGALYGGVKSNGDIIYDDVEESLSYDSFRGISQALDALSNIESEVSEIGTGEYGIQRDIYAPRVDISYDIPSGQSGDLDFEAVTNMVGEDISFGDWTKSIQEQSNRARDIMAERAKQSSLQRQGFQVDEKEYNRLGEELSILRKEIIKNREEAQFQYTQGKIITLAQEIMNESGLERNKHNIRVATGQALRLLGAEAGAVTTQPPFPPQAISGLEDYDYFSGQLKQFGDPNIPYE